MTGRNTLKRWPLDALKTMFLILIVALAIIRIKSEPKPYATGDAIEYTLMTEAFYNHFSPEVKLSDYASFKQTFLRTNTWEENEKGIHYDAVGVFLQKQDLKNLDYNYAFFVDKQGRKYSAHFWFYSLLNLPARYLCAIIPFNPILIFHITNLILIIVSCFVFLKTSKFSFIETGIFCLLFFYSANYWYFCWPHPEVFTVCFASMGLWLFFHRKRYTGILLIAIAAMQNQPLAILPVILSLVVLFEKGINIKNLVKLFFSSLPVLAPPLFYYIHYGTTNLIGYQGALSTDHITWTRVLGFFFDINQGMILALPLILLVYLVLYFGKLLKIKYADRKWDLLIFPAILIIICGASTIDNWNHGQSVVNRYVTYVGGIVLIHFYFLFSEIKNSRLKKGFLVLLLLSQILTVAYHQKFEKYDWTTNTPKPISNWVLSHIPKLYNPDPIIFNSRYAGGIEMDVSESPSYFMKENGEITKFLTHKKYMSNLQRFGLSQQQIDSLTPCLNFINDWAYIDVDESLKSKLSSVKLKQMDNAKKIEKQIQTIKNTPDWYETIKKKAIEKGITEETALMEDAAFVLKIDIPHREKTMLEKINEKVNEIKKNPDWLKTITEKAIKQGISLDSVMHEDAKWIVEQESK